MTLPTTYEEGIVWLDARGGTQLVTDRSFGVQVTVCALGRAASARTDSPIRSAQDAAFLRAVRRLIASLES